MWRQTCVTLVLLICVKDSLSQLNDHVLAPLNPRIVGGADASKDSWPWMASLHYGTCHQCGGSLITNEWVLTAASCVNGTHRLSWFVYLGKRTQLGPNPNEISRTVDRIIIHHFYNSSTRDNDIALLRLSTAVTFNKHIKPVSLAAQDSEFRPGTVAWVTGWGDIGDETPLPRPGTLQEAKVKIYEDTHCANLCRALPITDNMICAGLQSGGRGIWNGDSGSPMVIKKCFQWVQSGVVSWGEECAQPDKPDVYTRVSEYQRWITNTVGQNPPGFVSFRPGFSCLSGR